MSKEKKISLFIDAHSFDREYQGTHVFISELYGALSKTHPEIELYAGAQQVEKLQSALPFLRAGNILPYNKHRLGISRYVTDIPAFIKKYRFDFAHFQYLAPPTRSACKYIVTLHDILFHDLGGQFPLAYRMGRGYLFRRSMKKASIRTTVSAYSRHRIAHHYGLPSGKVHVIPSGVYPSFGEKISREEAIALVQQKFGVQDFILYVSRIEPRKNQDLLLKKYLSLELYRQNIPLVFVGKESIPIAAFRRQLAALTPEQKKFVHWHEQLSFHDLQAFYKAGKLFVYPSKGEGFGVPPLEAAICGMPVLCSNATAMSDFDFFDPWRFDPANENELEKGLLGMLATPPSHGRLQRIAENIKQRYNWERTAEKFYSLLQNQLSA